ncbi:tetratricopeptide repeat protein [Cupriavidus sp. AcVe19-1a]|uniref:tetratricopeptide repeat protein n=1 Tax=Cupriavidus sp. AcVe19-1a TaxID=2821359 RepID=UPI001AE6BB57|nr:tetratricopeptide repeat protein [Cupriavidus sp. AcVe19-1a]MBP0628531.1 tetratricopeptide repeat protein [Cupriavidus sp. AcVe19-1a]
MSLLLPSSSPAASPSASIAAPARLLRPLHLHQALAAAAVLALAAALAGPAQAQQGPLSLPAPTSPVDGIRSTDPGMTQAQQAANARRYDEAIKGFDRVIAANPRNAQARFQRAWALAQSGREDAAIQAFTEMAADFPELPEPHNNLALLYAKRGDLKRAEAELLLATEVKPAFAIAYTNLGDVYRRLAEQAYAEALRRNPADTRASAGLRQLRPEAATGTPAVTGPSGTTATPAGTRKPAPAQRPAPASAPAAN